MIDVATYKFKTYFSKDIINKFKIKAKNLEKHLPPAKKFIFIKLIML